MSQDWPILHAGPALLRAETFDEARTALDSIESLARRHGQLVGYFGYELGQLFEDLPHHAHDDLRLPLLAFAAPTNPTTGSPVPIARATESLRSTFSRDAYCTAVQRSIDYIAAGDIFQVNLSQRLSVPTRARAADIFAHLQSRYPARHPALLDFGDFAIVSNSPELFFEITPLPDGRRRIVNRPIKGTRPNAPGMHDELLRSLKDHAELAMIVDLQRNDLGRICEIGSVRVTQPRIIETHPTVLHGVAEIEGILRDDVTLPDILRAIFPCGSITGCPKIRAMQIIDELEPVARGPYCGAIGRIHASGAMSFSVAIRTMTLKHNTAHLGVGGGIVADSDPESEYEETLVKAHALLASLGVDATHWKALRS